MANVSPALLKSCLERIREEHEALLDTIKVEIKGNARSFKFMQVLVAYLDRRRWLNLAIDTMSDADPVRVIGRNEEATDVLEIFEQLLQSALKQEETHGG